MPDYRELQYYYRALLCHIFGVLVFAGIVLLLCVLLVPKSICRPCPSCKDQSCPPGCNPVPVPDPLPLLLPTPIGKLVIGTDSVVMQNTSAANVGMDDLYHKIISFNGLRALQITRGIEIPCDSSERIMSVCMVVRLLKATSLNYLLDFRTRNKQYHPYLVGNDKKLLTSFMNVWIYQSTNFSALSTVNQAVFDGPTTSGFVSLCCTLSVPVLCSSFVLGGLYYDYSTENWPMQVCRMEVFSTMLSQQDFDQWARSVQN